MTLNLHLLIEFLKKKRREYCQRRVAGRGGPLSALTKAFRVRELADVLMSLSNS